MFCGYFATTVTSVTNVPLLLCYHGYQSYKCFVVIFVPWYHCYRCLCSYFATIVASVTNVSVLHCYHGCQDYQCVCCYVHANAPEVLRCTFFIYWRRVVTQRTKFSFPVLLVPLTDMPSYVATEIQPLAPNDVWHNTGCVCKYVWRLVYFAACLYFLMTVGNWL